MVLPSRLEVYVGVPRMWLDKVKGHMAGRTHLPAREVRGTPKLAAVEGSQALSDVGLRVPAQGSPSRSVLRDAGQVLPSLGPENSV